MDLDDVKLKGITREFEEFLDAIEGRAHGQLRLKDGRQAVEYAVCATRAADTGEAVSFP